MLRARFFRSRAREPADNDTKTHLKATEAADVDAAQIAAEHTDGKGQAEDPHDAEDGFQSLPAVRGGGDVS